MAILARCLALRSNYFSGQLLSKEGRAVRNPNKSRLSIHSFCLIVLRVLTSVRNSEPSEIERARWVTLKLCQISRLGDFRLYMEVEPIPADWTEVCSMPLIKEVMRLFEPPTH